MSNTLKKKCRLKSFKNIVLRYIYVSMKAENAEWRHLHSEELHNYYRSIM